MATVSVDSAFDRLGVDGALSALRSACAAATAREWATRRTSADGGTQVLARVDSLRGEVAVASFDQERDARCAAALRRFASVFGASASALLSVMDEQRDVHAETLMSAASSGWGDRLSRWFWTGWDPGVLRRRTVEDGRFWRDAWEPVLPDSPGTSGSRERDLPRSAVATKDGLWSLAEAEGLVGDSAALKTPTGQIIGTCSRVEDADFMITARVAVAVLGPAVEAAADLARGSRGSTVPARIVRFSMDGAEPWPLKSSEDPTPGRGVAR